MTRRVDPANMDPEAGLPLFEAAAVRNALPGECALPDLHCEPVPVAAIAHAIEKLPPWSPRPGAELRDAGAAAALDAEARKHELAWAVKKASQAFPTFTSDEVRDILKAELGIAGLDHPNALGAAFLAAARAGIIEPTDQVRRSTRDDAHRRKLTVWRSKLVEAK